MSTILKALRRLEREKSERSDRSLREAVASASPPPPRRRRGRWLAAAVLLVGAVAIAAVVFPMLPASDEAEREGPVEIAAAPQKPSPARPAAKRRRSSARPPSIPARDRERTARAAATGSRVQPRGEPAVPPGLPPEALSSDVEVVERIRPAKPAGRTIPTEPAPAGESLQPGPESAPPVAESGSARREAEPPTEARRPAAPDAAEGVQLAAAAPAAKPPATSRAEPQPKPASRAAEPILRPPVPNVYVERTIWHPLAERRVAVVEVEGSDGTLELHEGDVVGTLVVGKIAPSSVFFVHDGVELQRRVGVR